MGLLIWGTVSPGSRANTPQRENGILTIRQAPSWEIGGLGLPKPDERGLSHDACPNDGMRAWLIGLLWCCGMSVLGQGTGQLWRPLNDSVFTALGLSDDQARRIRTIDAQYEQERMVLAHSSDELSRTEMERRLSGLIADREKEIQGVMSKDQFGAWVGTRPPGAPGKVVRARPK
ncbi:MAG: hypothetical protein QM724_01180 [Flavobacteriales bacterium]